MYLNDCLLHLNRSAIPFGEYKIGLGRGSDNHYLKNKSLVLSKSRFRANSLLSITYRNIEQETFPRKA